LMKPTNRKEAACGNSLYYTRAFFDVRREVICEELLECKPRDIRALEGKTLLPE
jgi:hypothetical protein